ncbi:hypothetical protein GCM10025868_11880 [Angustibacter aerolatus]|uniref:Peptidase C39-like domain-containing protein n=1 Tax=Angustibacter aerolatus TaxID=1162965 RepID=A0ABQ6JEU8_9ACTN|nr:hypothetical protein GCM10025868_11880 [Angustibacter aerolatus]
MSIDLPDVPLPDPVGTARNVTEVVALAVSGLRTCVRGAEDAQLAVDRLERALGDARGDAALAGRRAPAGFSVLDTAVMAAQSFDADPDHEHLDERQWAMLQRALAAMSPADRAAVDELLARVPDAASRAAVLQVLTGGADLGTATFFADRLAALPDALRARLLSASYTDDGPTALGDPGDPDVPRFDQTDQTTCGSTSLLALAAQSDPLLSLWLLTGDRPPGWTPPYLQGLPPDAWDLPDADDRLTAAQQGIHDATSAGGWPQALGTTPWDAASVADDMRGTTGTGYQAVLLDDQSRTQPVRPAHPGRRRRERRHPRAAVRGGDGADGIPRHVVLITGYRDGTYEIFEPSSGEVYEVPESQPARRRRRRAGRAGRLGAPRLGRAAGGGLVAGDEPAVTGLDPAALARLRREPGRRGRGARAGPARPRPARRRRARRGRGGRRRRDRHRLRRPPAAPAAAVRVLEQALGAQGDAVAGTDRDLTL